MRYRDPQTTHDEDSSGATVTYPESFVICEDCGVAVYDTDAHDDFHEELARLLGVQ